MTDVSMSLGKRERREGGREKETLTRSLHSDEDDHSSGGTDDLTREHVSPVIFTRTTIGEGKEHGSSETQCRGDRLDISRSSDEPW